MPPPLKLLVVDADVVAGGRLAGSLEAAGFSAAISRDAAQAAALAAREGFDLALIRALEPGLDGAALCRRLLTLPVPLRSILFADSCVRTELDRAFASGAVGVHHGPGAARRLVDDVRSYHADSWPGVVPRSGRLGRGREVLVIEDEPAIASAAALELAADGFAVTLAADGRQGLLAAARRRPEAVLLDVNLPDRSIEEMLPALKAGLRPPVVLLWTGADAAADERRYLALGAEDFTVKVVHPLDSLPLRLARLLPRVPAPAADLQVGPLTLLEATREVWLEGKPVAVLTKTEFATLSTVARSPDRRAPWGAFAETGKNGAAGGAARFHALELRRKLAPHGIVVRTLIGFGLALEIP